MSLKDDFSKLPELPLDLDGADNTPDPAQEFVKKVIRITVISIAAILVLVSLGTYAWLEELGIFDDQSKNTLTIANWKSPDNSIVYDNQGRKIGEFFRNYHIYTPYEQIPKPLIDAIVSIEDRNFFNHKGVDIKGMVRATSKLVFSAGKQVQGASTLTQQLVRHFLLNKNKNISRKVKEIALAMELEKQISKEKILELYCNAMFLGSGSYGVGAAAKRFFNKPLSKLKTHEFATIAGLFQSPTTLNPHRHPKRAIKRRNQVLKAMYENRKISRKRYRKLVKTKTRFKKYKSIHGKRAPFFVDHVRKEIEKLNLNTKSDGLRIHTTLDRKFQKQAEKAIKKNEPTLEKAREFIAAKRNSQNKLYTPQIEAALLSIDSKSGEILAMVGGTDYATSQFNRTMDAKRSPGSAFKTVVYSLALERGLRWSDVSFVAPISIGREYRPRSVQHDYMTETTYYRAFYKSLNATTVEIAKKLSVPSIIKHAQKLGIEEPIKDEYGIVLGSSEVTMKDLATTYATIANQGIRNKTHAIKKITDRNGKVIWEHKPKPTRVISRSNAFLTTQGLQGVLRYGTGYSAHHLAKTMAGKTGTSNDSIDNWFAGFSRNITTIVWAGTDENAPIRGNMRGATLALPIWADYMGVVNQISPSRGFLPPKGVVKKVIDPKFGNPSPNGISMWFEASNQPTHKNQDLDVLSKESNYRTLFSR